MSKTVLIVVTHLLGTGHLARALTLARAFTKAGADTHVVSGGRPAPHLDHTGCTLHQLPPLRSDGTDFTQFLDAADQPAGTDYRAARSRETIAIFDQLEPDILITELFPFGRRALRKEFRGLLDHAMSRRRAPAIFCSIRDILNPPSKPAKVDYADALVETYYDGVLVHSDPALIPLDASWPVSPRLAPNLRYTGFVTAPLPPPGAGTDGQEEIIVAVGGGTVGTPVFKTALTAAARSPHTWRFLVPANQIDTLTDQVPDNVIVDPVRPDFREVLQRAAGFVGLCGYNTAMDILQTGIPAVIIPFEDGGEVEQSLRAEALGALAGIEVLRAEALDAVQLAEALGRAISAGKRPAADLDFDGADRSAQLCLGWSG